MHMLRNQKNKLLILLMSRNWSVQKWLHTVLLTDLSLQHNKICSLPYNKMNGNKLVITVLTPRQHSCARTKFSLPVLTTIFSTRTWVSRYQNIPFWILLALRVMEVVVNWSIRWAKLQSNCYHQQTNTQLFMHWMSFLLPNQQCQAVPVYQNIRFIKKN